MPDNNELAKERTDWAEDRTILANERTFAGWMRTGMASVGVALGLKAVFGSFEPTWVPKLVANVFVLVALLIFFAAWRNARRTAERMHEHATNSQSTATITMISAILGLASVATGAILWWL